MFAAMSVASGHGNVAADLRNSDQPPGIAVSTLTG